MVKESRTRLEDTGIARQSSYSCTVRVDRIQKNVKAPKENWMGVIKRDLKDMHIICWEEAEELAADKAEWRQHVAKNTYQNAGGKAR